MANFDQLKQSVAALIRTNGAEEITGQIMQDVLLTIINSISGGYMFGGVAQHSGNVGNPDYNVFYLAGSGAYTGYGGAITIENGCYGVFRYNGSWHQEVVDIGVRLSGSIAEGETRGVTGDTINTALQTLFNNVMDILDTLTFTYNTPSAEQATKAMLDVIMTPTGGASHVFATLTLASATVAAAGLMSAEDKQKVDRMLTDFRSLSLSDTTAAADQATKIVQTLSATLGDDPEAITTMTFLAATASKAGLMSAADKAVLDCMVAMLGYYECSTAAGTAAKVVSASGYSLTSGGCIRIKMNNANTANNVTLNINSTGAKALYYDGEQASATNTWEAGEVLEVYYDGTQYQCASGGGGKFATGQKVKDVGITNQIEDSSEDLITSGAVSEILIGSEQTSQTLTPTKEMSGSTRYRIDYIVKSGDVVSFSGNGYLAFIGIVEGSGSSQTFVTNYTNGSYVASFGPFKYNDGDDRKLRILVKKSNDGSFTQEDAEQNITYSVIRYSGGDGIKPNLESSIARIGFYQCSTDGNVAAKALYSSGYTLMDGGCMHIKMLYANTAENATLNINSTGEKPIYYNGERVSPTNTWGDGETVTVYYDGENYQASPAISAAKVQTVTMIPANAYSGKTFYRGSLTNVSDARCLQYDVTNIKDVYITSSWRSQDAGFYIAVFLDSLNNVISQQIPNAANIEISVTNRHISVPEGAVTMYVNSRYYSDLPIAFKVAEYDELNNKIEQLKKEISILFIGNSLTQDAVSYVPLLMKELAPDIKFKFYIWYNGGYTLAQQFTKINNNQTCEIFSACENATSWSNKNNSVKLSDVLSTYTFDIVCLQQYFNYQSSADTTSFNNIIEYIENNYTKPFKVVTLFHAPLRSSAESVFNTTKAGNAVLLKETVAESMIPSGISIYRALSTALDSLGDQGHLSNDGTHAQEGLPCMMEAYVTTLWLLEQLGVQMSVNNSKTVVDNNNYSSINVPGPNLGSGVVIGTTEQVRLSQQVAIKAFKEGEFFVDANLTEYTS